MAALTPPNPHTIARLVMEFTTSTGACVIDMPVARPACSSVFEIVVIEKEVKPDSICITPTASTPLLAGPNPPNNRRPGQSSAWWTSSWPLDPGAGGQGGRKTLPKPGDPAKSDPPPDPPSIQIPVKEEPVVLWPPPVRPAPIRSSVPIGPSPSSSSEPGDPVEATPSPTPVSVKEKPSTPAPSPSRLQSSSTSSRPAGPPGKGGPTSTSTSTTLKTLTTSTPSIRSSETGSSTTVKMSSSSPLPPPPATSNPPKSSPKPDITTFPVRPQPPRPTPPPAPTPIDPGVCDSTYTTVDVSELTGLDPHFLEKYLGLLGLGGLLDGLLGGLLSGILGSGGLAGNSEKEKLVHQYRVLCDVALPDGPAPSFPDYKGGEEHTKTVQGGHRECLETCERQVINMAGQNLLRECLGVAYRPKAGAAGEEGECRYWCGEHKEHEFLPVDSLPSKSREGKGKGKEKPGRWQVIYM